MFKKIVVGVDGRSGGRDAMSLAGVLAEATGAEVIVAHVYSLQAVGLVASQTVTDVLGDAADALLSREASHAPIGARQIAVPDGFPAPQLNRLCEQEQADLLIVGSSHHGPIGRAFAGDAGREALHGSHCPVAIAPKDYSAAAHEITTVGVGLDGSPHSVRALAGGSEIARSAQAELRVVVVAASALPAPLAFPYSYSADAEPYAEMEERIGRELLDAYVAPLGDHARGELRSGDPRSALIALSEDCDLIAVGSSRRGAVGRLILGSTSDALVREARCPVIVFPDTAERLEDRSSTDPEAGRALSS